MATSSRVAISWPALSGAGAAGILGARPARADGGQPEVTTIRIQREA